MDAHQIFRQSHIIFWIVFALIILVQGMTIGKPLKTKWQRWPEGWRFWIGYATLFGGGLAMVVLAGWDSETWLLLAAMVYCSRLVVEWSPLAELWQRREAHRWVVTWFAAFLLAAPIAPDFETLESMFVTLGVAGIVKVGWEGVIDSWRARRLRRASARLEKLKDGPTD